MSKPEFDRLCEVILALRHPQTGCPWDLKQTHQTLIPFLIEEAYEFVHAAEENSNPKMEEEIGDVLLQVLLHATIAKQRGDFDLESISKVLSDKLIRRHPHVFSNISGIDQPDQVVKQWDEIKKVERAETKKERFDDSYLHFPSLYSAHKIGKKTSAIKFDWNNHVEVMEVLESELSELKAELVDLEKNREKIEEEMGDFLFSAAQLARHLNLDPEAALRKANKKFLRRFKAMEKLIETSGKDLEAMTQKEMDLYWAEVKKEEKKG